MDELLHWYGQQLDKDEHIARDASGGTVVGEPGHWKASPSGDEWEASRSDYGDEELLVALRPGLPRPPDVMGGYWGAVFSHRPDDAEPNVDSPMPAFKHAAQHDPAQVLREIEADRALIADYISAQKTVDAIAHPDMYDVGRAQGLEEAVRRRASAYDQRPGYLEAWRP